MNAPFQNFDSYERAGFTFWRDGAKNTGASAPVWPSGLYFTNFVKIRTHVRYIAHKKSINFIFLITYFI